MSVKKDKYASTILCLCQRLGGQIVGKKKLAKLLYYVDFDRYEFHESMQSVTGDTYKAWKMGPVPTHYVAIINQLIADGRLTKNEQANGEGYQPSEIFIAQSPPDNHVFNDDDLKIINRVVSKYGALNGKELEILTHQEAPYLGTEPNQEIAYELALYRGTDFSDVVASS